MATQLNNILRFFTVWLDGQGFMGEGEECKLPKLEMKMEEFRGGSMDMPVEIDLGLKHLECEFKLHTFEPLVYKSFALTGSQKVRRLTFRGSLEGYHGDGIVSVEAAMDARIKDIDNGSWKPGSKSELTIKCAVDMYQLTHGDNELVYISALDFIRRINGVDQLARHRINLGIASDNG